MNNQGERFDSVWDAIEDSPESAGLMKARSGLMIELVEHIRAKGWTPAQAAREIDVPEARMVALLEGKIAEFTHDSLATMLAAAGRHAA